MQFGIIRLYSGVSGTKGFYNCQEIGLAKALIRAGYTVVIFLPCKDIKKATEECIEKDILLVKVPIRTFGVHSMLNGRYLLKYKIDIAQIAGDNQLFAPNLLRFCRKNNILAYTYNGTVQSTTTNIIKKNISKILFKRNVVEYKKHPCFAKTESVANQLKKQGVDRVLVASVGLDTLVIPNIDMKPDEIRNHLGLPLDKKILLFVGRLEEYKCPECAIKLLNMLSNDYYLVMIGEGSMREEIDSLINLHHLENRILRIDQVSNKLIHEYYMASEYYINFNRNEIFGMAILEAMYNGCTVVAYHAPGPDFIIKNEVVGYLVDDILEMKMIVNTKKILSRELIRQYIQENFTWDNTVKIIQGEVLGEKNG